MTSPTFETGREHRYHLTFPGNNNYLREDHSRELVPPPDHFSRGHNTEREGAQSKTAPGTDRKNTSETPVFLPQTGPATRDHKERKNLTDTTTSLFISPPTTPKEQQRRLPFEEDALLREASITNRDNGNQLGQQSASIGQVRDGITNLPYPENRNFHDSTIFASGADTPQQPRLRSQLNSNDNNRTSEQPVWPGGGESRSQADWQNMGYSTSTRNEWGVNGSSEKTERTRHTLRMEHEGKERDDDSTTVRSEGSESLGSPLHGPLLGQPAVVEANNAFVGPHSAATTPSTASTAPSTNDEGSMGALGAGALERLVLRDETLEPNALFHRRGPSWENQYQPRGVADGTEQQQAYVRAAVPAPAAWSDPHHTNQRIASFRNERGFGPERWHQQQPPQQQPRYDGNAPFRSPRGNEARGYGPQQLPYQGGNRPHNHGQPPATTPPRTGRAPRPTNPSPHRPSPSGAPSNQQSGTVSSGNPRSPSEVLKTLLRKKACLYEPDTSRAVALVTWLVGRELALEFGYFSRQQLQAGVHACVASKIDSGVITRTKVNRCMQIILNSCFHYIIPRPDGSEENGDAFRFLFAREVSNDMRLLRDLPAPWNDLFVDRNAVLEASVADLEGKPLKSEPGSTPSTPQTSPRLSSTPVDKGSPKTKDEGLDNDSKRAVLLCFNENVRCAEDVFRCHNEFIRDTAHASGLQLSSSEWRSFFGKEAAGAPRLWGNIGIPVPRATNAQQADALGMMTRSELFKFRTSWCSKRYDHDHDLCGFAHVEVNGGWLRRNPAHHEYGMEMCPDVVRYPNRQGNRGYIVNSCPRGVYCGYAHSLEEILYHPRRYKTGLCSSLARPGGCPNGDVCPDFHPVDSYKFPSKKSDGRMSHRQRHGANATKGAPAPPSGAPILYCSPAPVSRFEEQLQMPGLKNLYRRHCSVMRAHLRNPATCSSSYSCFGDDTGTDNTNKPKTSPPERGLPQPRRHVQGSL